MKNRVGLPFTKRMECNEFKQFINFDKKEHFYHTKVKCFFARKFFKKFYEKFRIEFAMSPFMVLEIFSTICG